MKNSFRKRIFSFVLIAVLVMTTIPANVVQVHANSILAYGTCGKNINWTYNVNGELNISGTGPMYDYSRVSVNAPWHSMDYYENIDKVIIGNGVTKLGDAAFLGLTGLTSIEWGTDIKEIGSYTFSECTALSNIKIPESVSSIGVGAFYGCNSVIFPSSLETIKKGVMYGIKNVTIPATVKTLEEGREFINDTETLTIEGDFENIPELMFAATIEHAALTTVIFKEGVTTVYPRMFEYQKNLKTVLLPDTLKEIHRNAFCVCIRLEYVNIPGSVKRIGRGAFANTGLKSVDLAEGLEVIEDYAFSNTSLTEINIPGSVKTIGEYSIGYEGGKIKDQFVIYGHEGSTAQKYATENGIEFKSVPHNYTRSILRATPQADGTIKETCICGYNKSVTIPAFSDISIQYIETPYDGSAKTPSVNYVKDRNGNALIKDVDYKVSYKNNINVGTATVTITGIGENYTGSLDKTFEINAVGNNPAPEQPVPNDPTPEPAPIKITSVTLSASSFVYNGKARKPAVTVKAGKDVIAKKITADTNAIDITYSAGRKNIGTYTVTVKGVGAYKGTIKKTFTIKPNVPTLKAKATGNRKVSLTIGNSQGATGYEIYVKEPGKKKFALQSKIVKSGSKYKLYAKSGKGWKYIKKLNNRTVKNANLKKGKTYKYKVKAYKAVKGKTYYSNFSAIKSAKVK